MLKRNLGKESLNPKAESSGSVDLIALSYWLLRGRLLTGRLPTIVGRENRPKTGFVEPRPVDAIVLIGEIL